MLAVVIVEMNIGVRIARASGYPQIYADQITALAGDEINIPVKISGNTGMMGIGIKVTYDKNVLTPKDVSMGKILSGVFDYNVKEETAGFFNVLWVGADAIDKDGEIFVMSFKVSDGVKPQTANIALTYSSDDTFDGNFKNMVLDCQNIEISIRGSSAIPTTSAPSPRPVVTKKPSPKPVITKKPSLKVQPTPEGSLSNPTTNNTKPSRVTGVFVLKDGKRKLWISWNWKDASGYQVQYALNKKFTKGRKTKSTSSISITLKKLKRKRIYYIRVRAYKRINGKKIYGPWSKVKKCKVK